ncbi:MAG: CHAT domain-containing protein [Bernardetiaceae bacterium]|nr:CHAT domain-containing protein [Bernardetiaceae bacterium]
MYQQADSLMQAQAFAESIPIYKQALPLAEAEFGRNSEPYLQTRNGLGRSMTFVAEKDSTEAFLLENVELCKVFGEKTAVNATALHNSGTFYHPSLKGNQPTKSENYFQQALTLRKEILGETHPDNARSLNNLATVYHNMGNYAQVDPLYREALKIYKETLGEKHPDYTLSLNNLAILYMNMGNYAQAETLHRESLQVRKEALGEKHPDYTLSLNNLASLYRIMGNYVQAEHLFKESLQIYKETVGEKHFSYAVVLNNLGELYRHMGNYTQAEPLLEQSLKKNLKEILGEKHPEYAYPLHRLASLYLALGKETALTEQYLKQALDIRTSTLGEKSKEVAETRHSLAHFYYHHGRTSEALPLYAEVVAFYEAYMQEQFNRLSEEERAALYATFREAFEQFTELAARENKPELLEQAHGLWLRQKAVLLNTSNLIKRRILKSGDRRLIALYDEVQDLRQAVGFALSLTPEEQKKRGISADSLRQVLQDKDRQLTDLSLLYFTPEAPATWQNVQKTLGKKEAVVDIVRYRNYDYQKQKFTDKINYMAFVLTPKSKGIEIVHYPDGNYLEQQALAYYQNTIRYKIENEESYAHFWQPLQKVLSKYDKVYFSADGVFHQINIATLYNPKTKKYLSDEIEIAQLTSGRDLLMVREAPLPSRLAVLIGNPAFGSEVKEAGEERTGIAPLPGTEKEVKEISALLEKHQWRQQTYLHEAAREQTLKEMLKPNVLHIATHGFFEEDIKGKFTYLTNPLFRSGVLLTGAAKTLAEQQFLRLNTDRDIEDGVLTAFEAMNLNIDNTDLVVLSACETGLGDIQNGEGVFGLQRAFIVAGARSVLMSLWKVDDAATQLLMTEFYREWLSGKSKREAFKAAQLTLRKKYPEPYYWGAFVMIGE